MIESPSGTPANARDLLAAAAELGTLYVLVNKAAVFGDSTLQDARPADWNGRIAIDLTTPFVLTQAFAAK